MGVNQCNCCKEIWNKDNLKPLLVGDTNMFLCPDCLEKFNNNFIERSKIDKAMGEMGRYGDGFDYIGEHDLASAVKNCIKLLKGNI